MYKIQCLKKTDEILVDAICETLKTAYDPDISRFFVHQDEGYKLFFNSILDHPSYATYYTYDAISNELAGFACFQIIENVVFLKHIVVNNRLQGSKIGTNLLNYALEDILARDASNEYLFQLHVFEKNSKALSWYFSIGLEVLDCSYWYDLQSTIDKQVLSDEYNVTFFRVVLDTFNFKQVYYQELYIGTLLGEHALIIKNSEVLNHLNLLSYFSKVRNIVSIGYISNMPLDFKLIDKAFLMSKSINTLKLA